MPAERVQKVLAAAGVASRRACEELVADGRVTIDGRVARLGDRVDPAACEIRVDGERIITDPQLLYVALNKPRGILSTMEDERGRPSLAEFAAQWPRRLFHVGRLDADSEGLLLLTNDGELAHRLTHPSYGVPKTYVVQVRGPVPKAVGRALQAGVVLDDGVARADRFRVVDTHGRTALVEVVVREGRKHLVRRMFAEVGHPVQRLVRTSVGPVRLGALKPGQSRRLTPGEVTALYAEAEAAQEAAPARGGPRSRRP